MTGRGGDTKSKNAILMKWRSKDSGKVATLREHVADLSDLYTKSDPAVISRSIRTTGKYWDHKFEKIII